jgi:hypothetical protein
MKKLLLFKQRASLINKELGLFITLFFIGNMSYAQTAEFKNTFAILSTNAGANTYYDLNAVTANTDFNGADLGTFNPASNSLILKGAEHNVSKCGTCDLTSTRLNYRIYSTGGSGSSYTQMTIPYTSTAGNGCGGQDQVWSATGNAVNILSGLAPGTYYLEVYSDATVICLGGTVYASNNSANYKATFTVSGSYYVTTNGSSGLLTTSGFFSTTFLKSNLFCTEYGLFTFVELLPSDGKLSSFKTILFTSDFSCFSLFVLFADWKPLWKPLCEFFKKILPVSPLSVLSVLSPLSPRNELPLENPTRYGSCDCTSLLIISRSVVLS